MGQDTLHHYFFNAYNTYGGIPVLAQSFGANVLGPMVVSRQFKMEDDPKDFDANNFGAVFGDDLQSNPNTKPSSVMP